jgi:hypothetical protein
MYTTLCSLLAAPFPGVSLAILQRSKALEPGRLFATIGKHLADPASFQNAPKAIRHRRLMERNVFLDPVHS